MLVLTFSSFIFSEYIKQKRAQLPTECRPGTRPAARSCAVRACLTGARSHSRRAGHAAASASQAGRLQADSSTHSRQQGLSASGRSLQQSHGNFSAALLPVPLHPHTFKPGVCDCISARGTHCLWTWTVPTAVSTGQTQTDSLSDGSRPRSTQSTCGACGARVFEGLLVTHACQWRWAGLCCVVLCCACVCCVDSVFLRVPRRHGPWEMAPAHHELRQVRTEAYGAALAPCCSTALPALAA